MVVETWAGGEQLSRESQDDRQAKDEQRWLLDQIMSDCLIFDLGFILFLESFFPQCEIRDVFLSLDKQTIKQNYSSTIDTCILHFACVCFQYITIVVSCNLQWTPKYKIR